MTPFINQTMLANATELQAEAKGELLQWVWGPFSFERLVIISLILQFILFFGAPFRKSNANGMLLTLIWSSYLLADWVSYYSIGLVLNGETGLDTNPLHILWGSLLLAHISGPDTISVLDMEDHQLWSRTALQFGTIVYSIARVTMKTFSHKIHHRAPYELQYRTTSISHEQAHRLLFVPTMVLFVVGVIKSLEKITTLFSNQTVVFQDRVVRKIHANPRNTVLVQGAVRVKVDVKPVIFDKRKKLSQFNSLRIAYELFKVFRGCYVDFKFVFEDVGLPIKKYFLNLSDEDAFKLIETELNLIYDVFYTKASNFRKPGVRFIRYLTVIAEVVAFGCLASGQLDNIGNWFDVPITYILVLGALFMDIVSTLQIIFSIRAIVPANDDDDDDDDDDDISFRGWILNKILNLRRRTWGKYSRRKEISYLQLVRRMLFRRWSESIAQFNVIDYCLKSRPSKLQSVYDFLGIKEKMNKVTCVSYVWFTDSLRGFIFGELKSKVLEADSLRCEFGELYGKWVAGQELDKCLLVWHIATEFCWTGEEVNKYQEWSKTLSNYLLCFVIQHPRMLKRLELGLMGKIRLESVCKEASSILETPRLKKHNEARQKLFDEVKRNLESQDERDAVMYDAYLLAEELKEKLGDDKWKAISKVWVELMCRIAAESKPSSHIRTLNRGGELFSLVWLLMNHLGIDDWGKVPETPAI